jgi:hypothetical protein
MGGSIVMVVFKKLLKYKKNKNWYQHIAHSQLCVVLELGHWKVDQKCLGSSAMWCWRRMEKISCTDCVKNGVLQTVKKEINILHTKK